MGYTTDFEGNITINPPLKAEHLAYLSAFANTRHMSRDERKTALLSDPVREAAGLPVGAQGMFYVGQVEDASVLNHNREPDSIPGLWCQWVPTSDGTALEWDGGEKFYEYGNWMRFLVDHFLKPWGYELNGEITWQGEDNEDVGVIVVENNVVQELSEEAYEYYQAEKRADSERADLNKDVADLLNRVKHNTPRI